MRAMILAAGRGERMRPLTDATPKPLLSVGGRSLIEWHLSNLARAGVQEVVVNLSWLGSKISAALGDGRQWGLTVHYSDEGDVPYETGGGIFRALPQLGPGPFWLVNGDVFADFDFSRAPAIEEDALAQLVMVPNPGHHPRGDFTVSEACGESRTGSGGCARSVGRVLEEGGTGRRLTYSGIGIYRPEFFAGCEGGRFPLLPWLRRAAQLGRLRAIEHAGLWCDVGTPERLAELDERLASGALG